jgi:heme/copper-type cytochrome/quinol oxidase subunit 2
MKNKKMLLLALLALFIIPSEMFAADLPAVVVVYSNIVSSIITKVIVGLVVLIMLVIAAWEMKENGNARPLKWAIFASIVMGGAVFFGPSILDYMTSQVGSLTGANAVVVSS